MSDYSAEITELSAALQANRVANAVIPVEVRERFRPLIQKEIEARKKDADMAFALKLKEVKERSGIPVTVIQSEVLRTKSWSAWTKWRDLAGILSDREIAAEAKAQDPVETGFYRVKGDMLVILRDPDGKELDETIAYSLDTATKVGKRWTIEPYPGADAERDIEQGQKFYGRWLDLLSDAIEEVQGA